MIYRLYLNGRNAHRQNFAAEDDGAAVAIAGAIFHSTTGHWDSYDLWEGSRLVASTIAEKFDRLADQVERAAVAIEESIVKLERFARDEKLAYRIKELRARHPRDDQGHHAARPVRPA
jgi:hypothetical protein